MIYRFLVGPFCVSGHSGCDLGSNVSPDCAPATCSEKSRSIKNKSIKY